MKLYTEKLEGCIWCPNHFRHGFNTVRKEQGSCRAVTTCGNNPKLFREEELRDNNNLQSQYFMFPTWCPLGSYKIK